MKKKWLARFRWFADRFPLRFGGFLLLAAFGGLFHFYGTSEQDYVLLMGSLALLALAGLSVLLVCEAAWSTNRRLRKAPSLSEERRMQWVSGNPGWMALGFRPPWRPLVEVTWRWIDPVDARVEITNSPEGWCEEVTMTRRCLIDKVVREVEVRDVLGVAGIRWQLTQSVHLEVLPEPLPIQDSTLVYSLHGGDDITDPYGEPIGDRVDMRRYAAGDPPRLILWKVFARSRKLMVRHPERAFSPVPRTCAYLVAGPHDEGCAGLTRAILEGGALGRGWRFGADGNGQHAEELADALRILARSGNPDSRRETQLAAFLHTALKDGFASCLVIVPAGRGAWMEKVQAAVRASGMKISLLTVQGGPGHVKRPAGPAWWEKIRPYVVYQPAWESPGEPERVLERFAGVGSARLMYDRRRQQVLAVRSR